MNLIKKLAATAALVALSSSFFTTGVSAAGSMEVEAANKLANAGIVVDHSDNTALYELNRNVLRQEIAAVARGLAGVAKATEYKGTFADVTETTPNTWAWATVEALEAKGLIASNKNFRPEANITKAEGLGMVVKACYGSEYAYDKAMGTTWQEQTVDFANAKGMVEKFSDYNTLATRGFVFKAASTCVKTEPTKKEEDILCTLLGTCPTDSKKEETTKKEETKKEEPANTTPKVTGTGKVAVSLSPESPADREIAAETPRTTILAFDVSAGDSDVTLKKAVLDYTGLSAQENLDEVSIYMGNQKVSKTKNFPSSDDLELSFNKNIVIKAGETQTLVVAAKIAGGVDNDSHRIELKELKTTASSTEGLPVVGSKFKPVKVSNKAVLSVKQDTASEKVTIGEKVKLAGFELEETSDKEDVEVKSITFHVDGGIDAEDDLSNLTLEVDGKEVATDLEVNGDDEIVVDLNDVVIKADKDAEFELFGVVTGSVGETILVKFESDDDIYAVGARTGMNVTFKAGKEATKAEIADIQTIEGAEINVSFSKSDIDEVKPDTENVKVGDLKLLTDTDNYEVKEVTVTVTSSTGVENIIEDLELDGDAYDNKPDLTKKEAKFTFTDIDLSKGVEAILPLTFTVKDETSLNGEKLTFKVEVTKVEDTEENKKYNTDKKNLNDVLSSTSLSTKKIDVELGSFEIVGVDVTNRNLVLGNDVSTVLYKAKMYVGDADSVKIDRMDLKLATEHDLKGEELDDVLADAVLNIGGKTFKGDIDGDSIEFRSINATIAAGANNVQLLVTAKTKENEDVKKGSVIALELDEDSLELTDSDNEDLPTTAIKSKHANDNLTQTNIFKEGTFEFNVVNSDDVEKVILAGSKGVKLAEFKMKAELENMEVETLTLKVSSSENLSDTIQNPKLVDKAGKTIVEGGVVKYDGTNTTIEFSDFVVKDNSKYVEGDLIVDLTKYTTDGDATNAKLVNDLVVEKFMPENIVVEGEQSDETITATAGSYNEKTEAVSIVPVILNVAVVEKFGEDEDEAQIKFTVDMGNNDLDDDDIKVTAISLENGTGVTQAENDENQTVDGTFAAFTANNEVSNGDVWTLTASEKTGKVKLDRNGITFKVGTDDTEYKSSNDKSLTLGKYKED